MTAMAVWCALLFNDCGFTASVIFYGILEERQQKTQERTRRIGMTIVGVRVCGFSVGMFNFSVLGLALFYLF